MTVMITPVYTGVNANDGTGDTVRAAFTKVNNSFSNVATAINALQGNVYGNANVTSYLTSSPITVSNLISTGSKVDSGYFIANVTTGQQLVANLNYHKFIANTNPLSSIANLWVSLPNVADDGQEIQITSLAPIASCYVHQSGNAVMWLANTFFSSGNVSATLTFSASNNQWMKF
jgi:hypothetical protein